jgi:hypothetical protein
MVAAVSLLCCLSSDVALLRGSRDATLLTHVIVRPKPKGD